MASSLVVYLRAKSWRTILENIVAASVTACPVALELRWRSYHAVTPVTPAVDSGATAGSSPESSSATCPRLWEGWSRSPGSCRSEGRRGSWLRRVSSPDCRLLEHKTLSNRLKETVLEGPQFQLGLSRLRRVSWRYCGRVMKSGRYDGKQFTLWQQPLEGKISTVSIGASSYN